MVKIIESRNLKGLNISDCNIEKDDNLDILGAFESLGDSIRLEKLGYCYNELEDEL